MIKGKLQTLINRLRNIPKNALRKWAKVVQDIMDKKLFDNARSSKLLILLERIPRRTMKEAHEGVRGLIFASPQVKATIKRMTVLSREGLRKHLIGGEVRPSSQQQRNLRRHEKSET